ncbi:acyltransferase family protein [Frigidibacter albus]|uniref:Acyltransferase family protein n=1 Tax=Frigidibacter albus TaxID=1465486 RepID=A0A6L8VHC3_9RHOB|nr:acyltransferase family protein [Frigidibacter albus]MZQ89828.1 acyltransferase family protein [Frigidibacter albus]NBE31797.1 acyltransferase family protein [Frigidibacter albus]GGH56454.1 acyltransferase [Frigidibacter albus]
MKYRPDIDGLRTLAVLPVVLFHVGVPGFPGGFVGVDVFFVISGYLISTILISEISAGKFSLSRFYERRIRRIFPALLAMVAFVLIASPLALLPSQFESLWQEGLGAILFVANIVFWSQAGYFSADSHEKPLLHTWSLGVEEQFYIFAPLVLWAILFYVPRYARAIVLLTLVASLALCVVVTPISQNSAFYMLPTRAWELLAGTLLALGMPGRFAHPRVREAAALVGVALLAVSVFTFSDAMAFPGMLAIAPVLGAVLLIHSAEGTAVGAVLSRTPVVFVGKLSYSLYLWHWPLVVFAQDWGWMEGPVGQVGVLTASFTAAWLSWRFVEGQTRDRLVLPTPRLLRGVGITAAAVIAVNLVYSQLDGWPARLPADLRGFDLAREDISPHRDRCHISSGSPDPAAACVLGDGAGAESVLLWGDSHGVEISQALAEQGVRTRTITYSSCPPALGSERDDRPNCREHNDQVLDYVLDQPEVESVILVAYYNNPAIYAGVSRAADALLAGGKAVYVVGPTPSPGEDVPTRLASGGATIFDFAGPERAEVARHFDPRVRIVMPSDFMCSTGTCRLLTEAGAPILFDGHHPSMSGARLIADHLVAMLPQGLAAQNN